MTNLAFQLSAFLQEYLTNERRVSQHTIDAYAYTFQLLTTFAATILKTQPSKLMIENLDVTLIVDFLNHLETTRGNSPRTRNARIAAIKAFFRFLEYRLVACLDQSRRIHSIPIKKAGHKLVDYLNKIEMQALLDAPDPQTHSGIRDRAMLHLCFAAGLRVSELVGLTLNQIVFQPSATIHIIGKGRRERILPLWKETTTVLRAWLAIRPSNAAVPELFLNAQDSCMTRSGFKYILSKHVKTAALKQVTLQEKRVSPHSLRHSCAMHTLKATHDIRKVSLWLGHADLKSTEIYLRADPDEKLETLMATTPPSLKRGKFKAPDKLIQMLKARK
ncbi:integrase [Paraglaciecola sp. MB-3u-78]|nr:integrase [Paraglaciecola sp. MB-3u-78]